MYRRIEIQNEGHTSLVNGTPINSPWVGFFHHDDELVRGPWEAWTWLPVFVSNSVSRRVKDIAEEDGGLCWFTPEGWKELESRGLLAKLDKRFRELGVRYRIVRSKGEHSLYRDKYQAVLPRRSHHV